MNKKGFAFLLALLLLSAGALWGLSAMTESIKGQRMASAVYITATPAPTPSLIQ